VKFPQEPDVISQRYDSIYQQHASAYGHGQPERLLVDVLVEKKLPEGRVLDLGMGQGRNTLYLASLRYVVEGVDLSAEAVAQVIARVAEDSRLNVRCAVADVRTHPLAGPYALMVCALTLHHLSQEDAYGLLARVRTVTVPGGWHVIVAFLDKDAWYADASAFVKPYIEAGWQALRPPRTERRHCLHGTSSEVVLVAFQRPL
jgi:cyclopropane fatty-acyl-phospholipid synthase-like methyltransferase